MGPGLELRQVTVILFSLKSGFDLFVLIGVRVAVACFKAKAFLLRSLLCNLCIPFD